MSFGVDMNDFGPPQGKILFLLVFDLKSFDEICFISSLLFGCVLNKTFDS